MEPYIQELEKYLTTSKLSDRTKKVYSKALLKFGDFLAEKMGVDIEKLHLMRVYKLDYNGVVIKYKPLDSRLIDEFLLINVERKYSWLSTCRNSLGSFIKYLYKNYDFPLLTQQLEFKLSKYKPERNYGRILNRHDLIRFFQSITINSENLDRDLLLFTLLCSTGCRISELLSISLNDVDTDNDYIYISMTKNGTSHVIPLRTGLAQSITTFCIKNNIESNNYVFQHEGNTLTNQYVYELMKTYLQKVKLPIVRLHSLRHSFATLMYESGAEITTIMQLLNHKRVSSTQHYVLPHYIRNYNIKIPENDLVYKNLRNIKKL